MAISALHSSFLLFSPPSTTHPPLPLVRFHSCPRDLHAIPPWVSPAVPGMQQSSAPSSGARKQGLAFVMAAAPLWPHTVDPGGNSVPTRMQRVGSDIRHIVPRNSLNYAGLFLGLVQISAPKSKPTSLAIIRLRKKPVISCLGSKDHSYKHVLSWFSWKRVVC